MARTHDGIQTPLPPSPVGLGVGAVVLLAGIGMSVSGLGLCFGIPVAIVGALMLGNQVNGKTRVRITFSKLLVEDERPVMGFLVGPSKQRVTWPELQGVSVEDGEVVVEAAGGREVRVGKGQPDDELQELAKRIEEASARFEAEEDVT